MAILTLLFLIAAMLLNVGLSVLFGFSDYFDRTAEELNASDTYFVISERLWSDGAAQLVRENASAFQTNRGLMLIEDFPWNDETLLMQVTVGDFGEFRDLSQWKLVGDSLPRTPDSMYVPYLFHVIGGYALGDTVTFTLEGEALHFTVSGFIENIYTDNMHLLHTVLVSSSRFEVMWDAFSDARMTLIYANDVENYSELLFLLSALTNTRAAQDIRYFIAGADFALIRLNRTQMAAMIAVLMIVFTLVIAAVSLLVIRFRIKNSIEEDMPKIGSLQAIGYTSRQITGSIVVQYGSVVLLSCLLSILPAYLLMPFVSRVLAASSGGLYWRPGFTPLLSLLTVLTLTLIVLAASRLSARSIRKISPVLALRGGMQTHSFKRNPLPLDKSRLPLTAALSLKSALQGARQSMMMFIVILAVSFTAVLALVIFYNAAVNLSAFEQVPGLERANASIAFMPGQDLDTLRKEVLTREQVRDAQFSDHVYVTVSDTFVGAMVMDDYDRRVTRNVYQGIFPRYDNEVAISGLLAARLDVAVGDEITIGSEGLPFLVTGFTQGMESGSALGVYLNIDGMRRIDPTFAQSTLLIYLYPGTDAALFAEKMEDIYAEQAFFAMDWDVAFAEGVSAPASIMALVGIVILIVSAFVITLVLYFVISSTIVRRHRDLGIQKAIGFTTRNLMNQISLAFSFPILFGTAAGTVLGAWLFNPGMSVGMAGMGVMEGSFIVNIAWVLAAGVCIVILAYLISMLVTWRIRKISAYKLVTE